MGLPITRNFCLFIDLIVFLIGQHCLYHRVCANNDIVLLGPTHQDVYAPLNSEQRFNCTGLFAGEPNVWMIRILTNEAEVTLQFFRDSEDELNRRQISRNNTQISGDFATSIVTIRALEINSGIRVQCQITVNGSQIQYTATLIVYGPPMAPANLSVLDIGVQSVNVSWSIADVDRIPDVDVRFIVTIENLRLSQETNESLGLNYHIFDGSESASSCDLYQFQVIAINDAGSSEPSESIITMLPSAPSVDRLNRSLEHFVRKFNATEVQVSITFSNAGVCDEYPVTNYTVSLNSTNGTISRTVLANLRSNTMNITFDVSDGLTENQLYSYHVTAINAFGAASSDMKLLYTTDIQTFEVAHNSVCCRFIPGSDARGCLVGIEGRNGSVEYVQLNRINNLLFVQSQVLSNVTLGEAMERIFALDIESDGSNGTLPVPAVRGTCESDQPDGEETTTTTGPDSETSSFTVAIVTSIIVVMIVAVLLPAIIIFLLCLYFNKKKSIAKSKVFDNNQRHSRYEDSPSYLSKTDAIDRQETQETIILPVYDQPEKINAPEHSVFLDSSSPLKYSKLARDETHDSHSVEQGVVTSEPYAELNQTAEKMYYPPSLPTTSPSEPAHLPVYAILENNQQVPIYAEPATITQRGASNIDIITPDPDAPALPPLYNEIGSEGQPPSLEPTSWPHSSKKQPPACGTDIL